MITREQVDKMRVAVTEALSALYAAREASAADNHAYAELGTAMRCVSRAIARVNKLEDELVKSGGAK